MKFKRKENIKSETTRTTVDSAFSSPKERGRGRTLQVKGAGVVQEAVDGDETTTVSSRARGRGPPVTGSDHKAIAELKGPFLRIVIRRCGRCGGGSSSHS